MSQESRVAKLEARARGSSQVIGWQGPDDRQAGVVNVGGDVLTEAEWGALVATSDPECVVLIRVEYG